MEEEFTEIKVLDFVKKGKYWIHSRQNRK